MNRTAKIIGVLFILGLIGIGITRFARPILRDMREKEASDAGATKGSLSVRIDSWVGYFPLASARMKRELRREGYILDCVDDNSNLEERMGLLASGKIQFAVATVDSYILNAAKRQFPGRIIAVIDESKGGDALVAHPDVCPNLEALKSLPSFRAAFTPNSPSHQLLKAAASHFGIPSLSSFPAGSKFETAGSGEALKLFLDRKVDVAVLWEPDVSRALDAGAVKLLGTESTTKLIVDVLLVNTDYSRDHPEVVSLFLRSYFQTLKYFLSNPDDLRKELCDEIRVKPTIADKMLKGVSWVNLNDNCELWFGIAGGGAQAERGLTETIDSTVDILIDSGDFSSNPLPEKDPYRITQRSFVEGLYQKAVQTGFASIGATAPAVAEDDISRKFSSLDDTGWSRLREVGALKIEPIGFRSGTPELLLAGKEDLDKMVNRLRHYPTFRVFVKGHTSVLGDAEANEALSHARAESVSRYLQVTYGIDPNRIRAVGFGGKQPLPRQPGESDRAYNYRLPRVEISLLSEVF